MVPMWGSLKDLVGVQIEMNRPNYYNNILCHVALSVLTWGLNAPWRWLCTHGNDLFINEKLGTIIMYEKVCWNSEHIKQGCFLVVPFLNNFFILK